jgi:hypothetical protein
MCLQQSDLALMTARVLTMLTVYTRYIYIIHVLCPQLRAE